MLPYEYLIHWGLMMQYSDILWVNIGSDNGFLSGGTKPLPQPVLTYHQYDSVILLHLSRGNITLNVRGFN